MSVIDLTARKSYEHVRHNDIDSLRGLAMIIVVVFHAFQYCRDARGQLWDGAWYGKILLNLDGVIGWFFVVSAFLLYVPLVRQALDGNRVSTPRSFLTRRLLRVVPIYWFAIVTVWAYRTSNVPGDWRDLFEHLTFTHVFDDKRIFYTIGPAWFLAVEIMFYLFIAFAMKPMLNACKAVGTRRRKLMVAAVPAVFLITVSWCYKLWHVFVIKTPANDWSVWFGPLAWADNLGFGMLVAVASVAAGDRLLNPHALVRLRIAVGIVLVGAVFVRNNSAGSSALFHEVCLLAFVGLLASSVFAAANSSWRRALDQPFLGWVGGISFSLYIWHEPVLLFLSDHGVVSSTNTNFFVIVAVLLGLSIPIAHVSYWLIEYPISHLRSMFAIGGGLRNYYADDRMHLAPATVDPHARAADSL